MMPDQNRPRIQTNCLSSKGFTLIELLITMAIVSIVLAAVISMYAGLSKSYTTETARATAQQDIRSAIALMVQDIRLAGLDPLGTAGGGVTLNSPTDIEVIADMDYDGAVTVGNMEQTRYFLLGNQVIQRLDSDATTDLVLVDNVTALNFTLSLDDDGVTPLMVAINLTVAAPAGRTGTVTRTLTEQVKIRN
jgi:type IV pilus assembly protein PilW